MNKVILNQPIAVFDAGIGSYAIARKIADRFPGQDVLYFADRANFPYGGKGRTELLAVMRSTIERLESFGPAAIVIASNAPSVMVLDDLKSWSRTPIIGVFPPVRRALDTSLTKRIAIMGVASLMSSSEIRAYVERESASQGDVDLVSASDLVELVENGAFLTEPDRTLTAVRAKLGTLHPDTDVATLSSTHLPWLLRYFEEAGPHVRFLDPADDVVEAIAPHASRGSGAFRTLVSEREGYDIADFRRMLARLGLDLTIERAR
ncbi:aspartate/glutamate racemase family protein [Bradyrhizobium sp. OK095]|uniref:glutamate racemase n=1 Tax=Bradyrhizobium sp. OK095 TaxID=1882760 RepID=UPI0008D8A53A|nr:aspartate/glutamate racemase family protein [Bradyrhizobium sp. OK095]SEM65130.1 glutamate racemase [Bradyrhizobium sp. OK095]